MAMKIRGLLEDDGGGSFGLLAPTVQPQAAQPDPRVGNWGSVGLLDDPYQIKAEREMLQRAGLWNPAWDAWANFQASGDDTLAVAPETPDFSSLAGYQAQHSDFGGGDRMAQLLDPTGAVAGEDRYFYDEPSMGEQLAQGAALVGGTALGINAALGGVGGAAASAAPASEGLALAGEYGAAGSLGDAGLLTGGVGAAEGGLTFAELAGAGAGVGEGMALAGQYGGALGDASLLTGAAGSEPLMLAGEYGAMGDPSPLTGGTGSAGQGLTFAEVPAAGEGMSLAGEYGAAGSLGDASLLTTPQPGGLGMLGTLPEVPAPVASLPTAAEAGITAATPAVIPPVAPVGVGSGIGRGLLRFAGQNPRLVAGLAGGLLGGAGGQSGGGGEAAPYTGPMPTVTRGGWSATAAPTYTQPAQPVQQQPLNVRPGQANSGLWRYMLGGGQ